jgi:hypothetical protein
MSKSGMVSMTDRILIDLRPLSTPGEKCHTITVGRLHEDRLQKAKEQRFDQLPVLRESGELVGLIATDDAQRLFDHGEAVEEGHSTLHLKEVVPTIGLFDLLSVMERHRAVVIREHLNGDVSAEHSYALVTVSDLNRHHFRGYLYPLFAQLESSLAEIIRLTYDNPWDWIKWTPKHTQPTIIGRWEMDKRDNIETSPVNGCELRDLLQVLNCSPALKSLLGYTDKEVTKLVNSLPDLRNDVMHPVRALVHSKKTVNSLRSQLERLVDFSERASWRVVELS